MKTALMQFENNVGPDQLMPLDQAEQSFCYLLTKLMDSKVYVDEQRMSRSDYRDAHAHLAYYGNLFCLL